MTTQKPWHIAHWPALAWLETIIKLIAIGLGINAFYRAFVANGVDLPSGVGLIQLVILVLLSLGLFVAVADRFADREIISMIFVVLNNLGHWGMVLALATAVGAPLVLFAGLMLLGDLVKIVFIRRYSFTVRDYSSSMLYGLTSIYILGYIAILILEILK
jgi:hypothetical protein